MKRFFALFIVSLLVSGLMAQNPVSWKLSTTKVEDGVFDITLKATIDQPWHLYDIGPYVDGPNATTITFEPSDQYSLVGGIVQSPTPKQAFDNMFGMQVGSFSDNASFTQRVKLNEGTNRATAKLTVEWQCCDDSNCSMPAEQSFAASLVADEAAIQTSEQPTQEPQATITTADPLTTNSLWKSVLEAILWGFAALLTPCVFPMIPMTVSFFLKKSENKTRNKISALLFGFFIVALYTVPIAVIIAATKIVGGDAITADIFNWLATHWLPNTIFFLVFIIFALSFFGAFEITLPSKLVNSSDAQADKGGLIGILFMALTLVLVSFSCTGPIVGSVLISSTSGAIWTPVITMLAFSLAFALPFTLFALFPSMLNKLPRSGGWLSSVKVVLGFLELALGLKFLSVADQTYHWDILDREIYLALWIVIFSLLGLYLLGKLRFAHEKQVDHLSVTRLMLSIVVFSFVVYMIPGMWGAPLKGLSGYLPPMHTQDFISAGNAVSHTPTQKSDTPKYSEFLSMPHGLSGYFTLEEALEKSAAANKPVFVSITGHGCVNCREMEARVWADPQVLKLLGEEFIPVMLYTDDKLSLPEEEWFVTKEGRTLKSLGKINSYKAQHIYGVNSQPYYMILNAKGDQIVAGRGYDLSVKNFLSFLNEGLEAHKSNN